MKLNIKKTTDVKLNVKPVTINICHEYVFEGPCRFRKGEELKKEFDLEFNAGVHEGFVERIENTLPAEDVNILEPVLFQFDESFYVTDEQLDEIAKDNDQVDIYLFNVITPHDLVIEFAQRFKKPMIVLAPASNTMAPAALRARGLKVYASENLEEAAETMKILRVKKALAETKVLALTRRNSNNAPAMLDGFLSLNEVTAKFGTRFKYYDIHEFVDQTHNIPSDTNPTTPGKNQPNITDEDEVEINKMTDKLIDGAIECAMEREEVFQSMKAHYLVKKLLSRLDCNAFTAPCFDVCATRRLNEEHFTLCLNHSLNNEEGISSACEYDIISLLSMVILSNIARSASYMGNTMPNPIKNGILEGLGQILLNPESVKTVTEELVGKENLVFTFHAVPNRKFKGYDTEEAPYSIRSFTYSGWGATIRYDFAQDKGQEITMCRLAPTADKLFVAKGTIVSGIGYTDRNCSEGVIFQVEDSKDFFNKQTDFGNHVPLIYGDYFDQVVKLGEILGLEVITA